VEPEQRDLFPSREAAAYPDGLRYREDAVLPAEESNLIAAIAALPLREFEFRGYEGKRRVVSFGWRYDFNEYMLSEAEAVPDFLHELYARIRERTGFTLAGLDHALVTEYSPGAGIGWHKDRPAFDDVIGISLASTCRLRFRTARDGVRGRDRWSRFSLSTAPRSAYLLTGPARWEWEHSIPAVEQLRYSITFRSLRRSE
jgi:alkylated DNA repair dioxygenase AlkB